MIRRLLSAFVLAIFFAAICIVAGGRSASAAAEVSTARQRCAITDATGAPLHHAGLVVTFGDRHSQMFCIEFAEDTISGLQLLQRSGLSLVTSNGGQGAAVCAIDGQGNSDPTNCFASCTGGTCAYWAYYQLVNNAWKFSQTGSGQRAVHDGDIDGWAWGPGGTSTGAVPEQPGELCPPLASPTPDVPTPTTTIAPEPSPPSVVPTRTDVPSSTAVPASRTPAPASTSAPDPLPADATSVPPTESSGGGPLDGGAPTDFAPTPAPENAVLGARQTPTTSQAASPSTTNATAAPTRRIGAIAVSNEEGAANELRSESASTTSSGSRTSLIAFGIVVLALTAVAGVVIYRRRTIG